MILSNMIIGDMILTILLFLLTIKINALAWTEPYVDAVLESRQCFNQSFISIMDSLFEQLHDMKLTKYYYARGLSYISHKLQNGHQHHLLCPSLIETVSYVYRDIQWGRQEAINFEYHQSKVTDERYKKEFRYDETRDPTINHIHNLLTSNIIKERCEQLHIQKDQLSYIRECTKEKRKEVIKVYTRFKSY